MDITLTSKKHQDTNISLNPISFEEAITELARTPKYKESEVKESGNTTEQASESGAPKK